MPPYPHRITRTFGRGLPKKRPRMLSKDAALGSLKLRVSSSDLVAALECGKLSAALQKSQSKNARGSRSYSGSPQHGLSDSPQGQTQWNALQDGPWYRLRRQNIEILELVEIKA